MEQQKIPIVVISGPTASGKTALAIEICKAFSGEVVSADSMQIYKGIEIAAATPNLIEREGIPHHLMGILDTSCAFSVADYCELAHKTILDIHSRSKLPVVVGGTGLYINSLVDDISFADFESGEIKEKLLSQLAQMGIDYMYDKLKRIDSAAAEKIEKNNTRRVIRALEIYYASGITPTKQNELSKKAPSRYNTLWFNINFSDREKLYERINLRVEKMVESGILSEAIKNRDSARENGAGQAIGHKELYPYIDGDISLKQALENLKTATRHYAKRQITWFKRREDTYPLVADKEDILLKAKQIIEEWKCKI